MTYFLKLDDAAQHQKDVAMERFLRWSQTSGLDANLAMGMAAASMDHVKTQPAEAGQALTLPWRHHSAEADRKVA